MKTYKVSITATFVDEIMLAVEDDTTQEELVQQAKDFFEDFYSIYAEEDEEFNHPFTFDTVELNGVPKLEGKS